jgi:SAM-dependent methyltransferase
MLTLEVGCGIGQYREAIDGRYVGVDHVTKEKGADPDVVADAAHLPFKDEVFDLVFFSNVLFYYDDNYGALPEAFRCLRSTRHLLIVDYTKRVIIELKRKYAETSYPVSTYPRSCAAWVELVRRVGFKNIILTKPLRKRLLWARILSRGPTRPIYFSIIDRLDGPIALVARKPMLHH